jgi:feruloyl esterase
MTRPPRFPARAGTTGLLACVLSSTLLVAACGDDDDDAPVTPPTATPQAACSQLQGLAINAASIGTPSNGGTVQTATYVEAAASGNANGAYCAVVGIVRPADTTAPNLTFQVNLPTDWNNRALQMGGGGYDGTLVTGTGAFTAQPANVENPLKQGYVTLGSDGGHQTSGGSFDGTFALNAEALLTYGQLSVKKTHDAAIAVIQARYGAKPQQFYFIGGSQGGHEALDAAARYPQDYDGVVANYPAYNITLLQQASLNVGRALYGNGGAGWINPAKKTLLINTVYNTCDPLDGVTDGVISDVAGCNAAFGITGVQTTLRCPGGADTGDTCLSDAQIAAVAQIASPYSLGFDVAGQSSFPRWPLLEGAKFDVSSFGTSATPSEPPAGTDALLYAVGAAHVKYFVTQDPSFNALTFDPAAYRSRLEQLGNITDVTAVSLDAFRNKGGKVILTHGTADDFISPHNTEAYYARQLSAFGQTTLDTFLRFYEVPGWGHGFGPFNAGWDGLGVLDRWVRQAQAPGTLTATDKNPGTSRTRPMCRYPAWPQFTGASGASPDDAANFTCVTS